MMFSSPRRPRVVNLRDLPHGTRSRRIFLPDDVTRVDRGSPWGNPYPIGQTWDIEEDGRRRIVPIDRELALQLYRGWIRNRLTRDLRFVEPLRGRRLACWCSPLPCHADILVEILDAPSVVDWLKAA